MTYDEWDAKEAKEREDKAFEVFSTTEPAQQYPMSIKDAPPIAGMEVIEYYFRQGFRAGYDKGRDDYFHA